MAARCVGTNITCHSQDLPRQALGRIIQARSILLQPGSTPDAAWHDKGFGSVVKNHVESPITRCTRLSMGSATAATIPPPYCLGCNAWGPRSTAWMSLSVMRYGVTLFQRLHSSFSKQLRACETATLQEMRPNNVPLYRLCEVSRRHGVCFPNE